MSLNPFTMQAFTEWVDKQSRDEQYPYWDAGRCAVGQYAQSLGMTFSELPGRESGGFLWEANDAAAHAPIHTFGGLSDLLHSQ